MLVHLINANEYQRGATLWFVQLGMFGPTIAVWGGRELGRGLEDAVEEAAAFAREQDWDGLFEEVGEAELAEARAELEEEEEDPSDEDVHTAATADLYYTESGYLGHDWNAQEVNEPALYEQLVMASYANVPWTEVEVDQDRRVPFDVAWGASAPEPSWRKEVAWVPMLAARLSAVCGSGLATPLAQYPHFVPANFVIDQETGPNTIAYLENAPVWVLNLGCWSGVEQAIADELRQVVEDLYRVGAKAVVRNVEDPEDEVDLFVPHEWRQGDVTQEPFPLLDAFALSVTWESRRRHPRSAGFLLRVVDVSSGEEQEFDDDVDRLD